MAVGWSSIGKLVGSGGRVCLRPRSFGAESGASTSSSGAQVVCVVKNVMYMCSVECDVYVCMLSYVDVA